MRETNPLAHEFLEAQAALRRLGIKLSIYLGDYCVNYDTGTESTAFYTADLQEAVKVGKIMAEQQQRRKPPIGPTGRRNSRRAMMHQHNRRLAAKRRREEGGRDMILVELHQPDELPVIRRVAQPYLLRLAVVEAYRQGQPIPSTVDEAATFLRQHSPTLWTFYTPDEADAWAESYEGEQAEGIRHAVRYFVADSYANPPEDLEPVLYEAI